MSGEVRQVRGALALPLAEVPAGTVLLEGWAVDSCLGGGVCSGRGWASPPELPGTQTTERSEVPVCRRKRWCWLFNLPEIPGQGLHGSEATLQSTFRGQVTREKCGPRPDCQNPEQSHQPQTSGAATSNLPRGRSRAARSQSQHMARDAQRA